MRLRSHRLLAASLTIISTFFMAPEGFARCFAPLVSQQSNDPKEWWDLVNFVPSERPEGVTEHLLIENGYGARINLDYYEITFKKDSQLTPEQFFTRLRERFGSFARGQEADTFDLDPGGSAKYSGNEFRPYEGSLAPDDPLRARNRSKWESTDPKGALMTFVLKSFSHAPALLLRATTGGQRLMLVLKQADVVTACTSETDFIFSTVRSVANDYHPVSGNRGFGIRDNGNGTWTFYSKGADRDTKVVATGGRFRTARAWGELAQLKDGPDAIFQYGHEFWLSFFGSVKNYLERTGHPVTNIYLKNSNRYPYPLGPDIKFHVYPNVNAVSQQPKVNGCWAAAGAMVWGWKNRQSIGMTGIAKEAGPYYEGILNADTVLPFARNAAFAESIGLKVAPPQSYTLQGLARLLVSQGPLWFGTKEQWGYHARVLTGVEGDGTADGTNVYFVDPSNGAGAVDTFRQAMEKYEMYVNQEIKLGIQLPIVIIHP